jgi:hypothetical protein
VAFETRLKLQKRPDRAIKDWAWLELGSQQVRESPEQAREQEQEQPLGLGLPQE